MTSMSPSCVEKSKLFANAAFAYSAMYKDDVSSLGKAILVGFCAAITAL